MTFLQLVNKAHKFGFCSLHSFVTKLFVILLNLDKIRQDKSNNQMMLLLVDIYQVHTDHKIWLQLD